jgi:hypothetical protein
MHFPYLNHYEFRQKFPYFKTPPASPCTNNTSRRI